VRNERPILAVFARLVVVAVVVQAGTIWVCACWFWTPMQRHYLPAYLWSSLPVITPDTVEVRLIWKAGLHRKPELAADGDAVSAGNEIGMALSPLARDARWTRLFEGPPEQVSTARLRPVLADLVFDGESPGGFLLLPELCGMAVYGLVVIGWYFFQWWCRAVIAELAWQRRVSTWEELSPMLFAEAVSKLRGVGSGVAALHRSVARRMETRTAAPSTDASPADTPVQRPSFAIPLFGVHGGNNADAYLWSEQDEIE
jgi:hypothetical protein